jgi:membrane fusion protein, multidrug efflux system
MKKAIFFGLTVLVFASCNSVTDKRAKLEKLIAERDKLNGQIAVLQKELAGDTSAARIKDVATAPVELTNFRHYVEIQGKVDGDENIALSAKSPGFVTAIHVAQGDHVARGQILAVLDDQVLQQTLKELQASLDYATDLYNRQKSLWDQNIGSEVQYLQAKNGKESLENKIKTLREQLALYKIESPIDGTVEEVPIKIGQYVAPGTPVFRIVNFSHVKVTGDIAEAYAPKIKKGDSVIVFFPDFNKEVRSMLTFSSKYINPSNRTFQVECRFDPGEIEYRANMISVIRIVDYKSDSTVVIPVNLVRKSIEETSVFVVRDEGGRKIARNQLVTQGSTYNGQTEIHSGLKKGDVIITAGYQDLNDGQVVNIK